MVRKALLALSAMLRGDEETKSATDGSGGAQGRDGAVGDSVLEAALPALCVLAGHPDLKLRRRTLFLLASLVSDSADARALTFSSATHGGSSLPSALVSALSSDDEDTRTQAGRFLAVACTSAAVPPEASDASAPARLLGSRLAEAGAPDAIKMAIENAEAAAKEGGDPDESARLRRLLEWVSMA